MATGTEGPDHLVNDTAVEFDVVNALGGDDTIEIRTSSIRHVVTVSGGNGVDTLTTGGFIWSANPGRVVIGQGTFAPFNEVYYSGVELLVIQGIALSTGSAPNRPTFVTAPIFITTGDTVDRISITSSLRFADVNVSTGAGDDEIILGQVGPLSTARGGSGNDLIDLRGQNAAYSAWGDEGNDTLLGSSGPDRLDGGPGDDFLSPGAGTPAVTPEGTAIETAIGGAGDDVIYFGGALDPTDIVSGDGGTDTLVLQGDYASGLVLGPNVSGLENLSMLAGSNTSFGDPGTNRYDYVLVVGDSNLAPGIRARINGANLLAGEDFAFNGSAETDSSFLVYGGRGRDSLIGGLGNDIFFFAGDGRFAAGDSVDGGPGYDGLFLRGDYSIDFNDPGYSGALSNLENLTLSSATDERYARGGGAGFDYDVTWADALLAAGGTITINGALLRADETMEFDGAAESDGSFRIFAGAGADRLVGGAGADLILGGLGQDTLLGGGGADIFRYDSAADSTSAAKDTIQDFSPGDRIDLGRIDADSGAPGDQAFAFIGNSAFGGNAGELRYENVAGTTWRVQGDTDGDAMADFDLLLVAGSNPVAADFIL